MDSSCEALHLQGQDIFTRKLEKPIGKTPNFSQFFKAKGMKFCTQVPRTCVHKLLFLELHLFA